MLENSVMNCPYSFEDIHERAERNSKYFEDPGNYFSIEEYFAYGKGPSSYKRLREDNQSAFKGVYVFWDSKEYGGITYIGISQNVLVRIKQHVSARSHTGASLAYAMAINSEPNPGQYPNREDLPLDRIQAQQQKILKWQCALQAIEDDTELYIYEVFLALKFRSPWNTFMTH
jgi:hypothetical protein